MKSSNIVTKGPSTYSDSLSLNDEAKESLNRLKTRFLPELQALHSDCGWLKTNLSIDSSRELQPNEVKLLQFMALVDVVIKEILQLSEDKNALKMCDLPALEARIVRSILPVKDKLHERWHQQKASTQKFVSNVNEVTRVSPNSATDEENDSSSSTDQDQQVHSVSVTSEKDSVNQSEGSPISVSGYARNMSMGDSSDRLTESKPAPTKPRPSKPSKSQQQNVPSITSIYSSTQRPVKVELKTEPPKYKRPIAQKDDAFLCVPVGSLALNQETEIIDYSEGMTFKSVNGTEYFVIDNEITNIDVREDFFDTISDCGVELYESPDPLQQDNSLQLPPPHPSRDLSAPPPSSSSSSALKSESDPTFGGKRTYNTMTKNMSASTLVPVPSVKKELVKPPGPYYSSAVDIDIKSTFAGAVIIREDEYMSSRRRRKLNQIVPNPRKPRSADYHCSLCNESYQKVVDANPWWAVYKHECPSCKVVMVPKIDINLASNAVEIDPNMIALYGEGIEESGDEGEEFEFTDDEEEDMEAIEGETEEMERERIAAEDAKAMADEIQRIQEERLFDDEGLLSTEEASRLLVLMCHARHCNGVHSSSQHEEVCKSTKFLMLHLRDCKGTDIHGRECLFPWCKSSKKLLKHLIQCVAPETCKVCNPSSLPDSLKDLKKLNDIQYCKLASESSDQALPAEQIA